MHHHQTCAWRGRFRSLRHGFAEQLLRTMVRGVVVKTRLARKLGQESRNQACCLMLHCSGVEQRLCLMNKGLWTTGFQYRLVQADVTDFGGGKELKYDTTLGFEARCSSSAWKDASCTVSRRVKPRGTPLGEVSAHCCTPQTSPLSSLCSALSRTEGCVKRSCDESGAPKAQRRTSS